MCLELGRLSVANNINKLQFVENAETPVAADIVVRSYEPLIFYLNALVGCLFTVKSS